MKPLNRLASFSLVGCIATLIHYSVLSLLLKFGIPAWCSNTFSFILAFFFSYTYQLKITFSDRLGEKNSLTSYAAFTIFFVNVMFAALLGELAGRSALAIFLPLTPVVINYFLYYVFTGLPPMKKRIH